MTDREYQYHTTAELLDLRHYFEDRAVATERARDAWVDRVGGATWVFESDDYRAYNDGIKQLSDGISAIDQEFNTRHEEAAAGLRPVW